MVFWLWVVFVVLFIPLLLQGIVRATAHLYIRWKRIWFAADERPSG